MNINSHEILMQDEMYCREINFFHKFLFLYSDILCNSAIVEVYIYLRLWLQSNCTMCDNSRIYATPIANNRVIVHI
jgi:hypothetical protein